MVKVIRQFKCGEQKFKVYKVGDTYTHTKEREQYLVDLGFCEIEKKDKQHPKTKKGKLEKK